MDKVHKAANLNLCHAEVCFGPIISVWKQISAAEEAAARMSLRPANVRLNARQFSGGNQQKIVIAKWTWRNTKVFSLR